MASKRETLKNPAVHPSCNAEVRGFAQPQPCYFFFAVVTCPSPRSLRRSLCTALLPAPRSIPPRQAARRVP
jgi:hypothetical protein